MSEQILKKDTNPITTGVIWKQILIFFFPILIGAFFQQLYNTFDAAVVGKFAGKEALASVGGSSGQILNFIFSFFMGLSTGATVIIAQHYGAKEDRKVDDALHTAYTFALVGGILLGIIGIIVARPFLLLLKTPSNLLDSSTTYVCILMGGLVLTLIYNIGSGILRAIGDSKRPLYILMVCCSVNVVLDLIFVWSLHLGVLGAAIATDISQGISALLITWLLMKKTVGMRLSFHKLHMNPRMLGRILKIGLPTAIAGSMFSVSNMIVQSTLNSRGVDVIAAWTAYGRIDGLWWMINQAFSVSITTFVGQNFGAGKWNRIKKATGEVLAMEIVTAIFLGGLVLLNAPTLLQIFTQDQHVIDIGITMSRDIAPFYWVFAISEILGATLRAENYVMVSTITNILGICIYRIIWVKFLVPRASVPTILYCYPISWSICSIIILIYFIYRQRRIQSAYHLPSE